MLFPLKLSSSLVLFFWKGATDEARLLSELWLPFGVVTTFRASCGTMWVPGTVNGLSLD